MVISPLWMPPPRPVILFNLAEPPALIFASRFSFRSLACSAALDGGLLAGSTGVSAILILITVMAVRIQESNSGWREGMFLTLGLWRCDPECVGLEP